MTQARFYEVKGEVLWKENGKMKILNIHNHSDYSVFDGISKIKDYAKHISENKDKFHQALSMSEHGTLHGLFETYRQAKKFNLKFIPSCEFYVAREPDIDSYNPHILLFGLNKDGYDELIEINNRAIKNGNLFGKRRKKVFLSLSQLKSLKHLYVSGACIGGYWNSRIINNDFPSAKERFEELFLSLKEKLLIELQTFRGDEQKRVNEVNMYLSEQYGTDMIITSDSHVINKEDCEFLNPTRAVSMGMSLNQYLKIYGKEETHNTYFKDDNDFRNEIGKAGISLDVYKKAVKSLDNLYSKIEDFNLEKEQEFNL